MKDTFTLADLANFKLPEANAQSAAPTQATESSTVEVPSDEVVETSVEGSDPSPDTAETVTGGAEQPETIIENEAPAAKAKGGKTASEYIAELKDERNALRRFNEYLLAKEQSPIAAAAAQAPTQVDAKPTLEGMHFDTTKYEEAMTVWTQRQVESARTQGAEQASVATAQAAFDERMAVYAKANPSVVTALGNPHLPKLAPGAAKEVVGSDLGPQILHYLAANPDQAVRIAKQTSEQQAAAIGRIEGELRAKSKQKTPQITRAPNPPTPTQGRGNTPSVDPSKMSTKQWIEWDRQQDAEKRQARARRA